MEVPGLFVAVGIAAVVAALVYAVQPLLRPRQGRSRAEIVALAEEDRLLDEREAALQALAELDLDRQLGNLDEEDYHDLRERYRQRAVALLRALDGHEPALDQQIEQAVALQRAAWRQESAGRTTLAERAATQPRVPRQGIGRPVPAAAPTPAPARRRTWIFVALGGMFLAAGAALTLYLALDPQRQPQQPLAQLTVRGAQGIAAAPGSAPTLLLASDQGLLRSTDLGRSWSAVAEVPGPARALLPSRDGQEPLYLATASALYRSADGTHWQQVGQAPSLDLVALARGAGPETLYAADAHGALFASSDGGVTWTSLGVAPAPPTALAVLPGSPETLYIATDGRGVLVTSDGGATWSAANGFASGLLESTRVFALLYDPASGESASAPDGRAFQGTLYAATDLGLARSLDGGASWSRLPFRGAVRLLGAGPGSPAALYVVDAQGRLYRSLDRGIRW